MSKKSPIGYVYKITNPINHIYVGSTAYLNRRMSAYARLDCKAQVKLYRSLIKYGFSNHKFEALWAGNADDRVKVERDFGVKLNTLDRTTGLNLILPAYGEMPMLKSEETKKKFVESRAWPPLSDEIKFKMSKNSKRHKPTEMTILKSKKAVQRTVLQYSLSNELLMEFDSTSDAAKSLNIKRTCIKNALNKMSGSAGGFVWKFKDGVGNKPMRKKVAKMGIDNKEIAVYESIGAAARSVNLDRNSIRYVVNGLGYTAAGYKWKYI